MVQSCPGVHVLGANEVWSTRRRDPLASHSMRVQLLTDAVQVIWRPPESHITQWITGRACTPAPPDAVPKSEADQFPGAAVAGVGAVNATPAMAVANTRAAARRQPTRLMSNLPMILWRALCAAGLAAMGSVTTASRPAIDGD